jgi:hypothetical protein
MVVNKTRPRMWEYHKKGQDSTLLEQLEGCPRTFSQSKSCIIPQLVSKAPTLKSIES